MNYNKVFDSKDNENVEVERKELTSEAVEESVMSIGKIIGADEVYVRKEPNKESEPITSVKKDVEFLVYELEDGEFTKICLSSGIEGYMMTKFISI